MGFLTQGFVRLFVGRGAISESNGLFEKKKAIRTVKES